MLEVLLMIIPPLSFYLFKRIFNEVNNETNKSIIAYINALIVGMFICYIFVGIEQFFYAQAPFLFILFLIDYFNAQKKAPNPS